MADMPNKSMRELYGVEYDETRSQYLMHGKYPIPPIDRRDGPLPWETVDEEIAVLIRRWGKEKVKEALARATRGAPRKLRPKNIWLAVEIYRRRYKCDSVYSACEGLAKFMNRRNIKNLANAATLRRNHSAANKELLPGISHVLGIALNLEFVGFAEDKDDDLAARISFATGIVC